MGIKWNLSSKELVEFQRDMNSVVKDSVKNHKKQYLQANNIKRVKEEDQNIFCKSIKEECLIIPEYVLKKYIKNTFKTMIITSIYCRGTYTGNSLIL